MLRDGFEDSVVAVQRRKHLALRAATVPILAGRPADGVAIERRFRPGARVDEALAKAAVVNRPVEVDRHEIPVPADDLARGVPAAQQRARHFAGQAVGRDAGEPQWIVAARLDETRGSIDVEPTAQPISLVDACLKHGHYRAFISTACRRAGRPCSGGRARRAATPSSPE